MTKEEILKSISKKKWVDASTPAYLLPCVGWMRGFMRSRKYFTRPLKELILVIRDGGLASQIGEERQVFEKIKELYDFPEKTKKIISEWRKSRNAFFEKWSVLNDKTYLAHLSDKELGEKVVGFLDEQIEVWAPPLQADLLGIYSETELFEEFSKILSEDEKSQSHELFAKVSQPSKISFISEERISILNLALTYKDKSPNFKEQLSNHQTKYLWIKNTYRYLQALPESYFLDIVMEESKRDIDDIKKKIKNL